MSFLILISILFFLAGPIFYTVTGNLTFSVTLSVLGYLVLLFTSVYYTLKKTL